MAKKDQPYELNVAETILSIGTAIVAAIVYVDTRHGINTVETAVITARKLVHESIKQNDCG